MYKRGFSTQLLELRARLEKGFSPDTALSGLQSPMPNVGHCAAVAARGQWGVCGGHGGRGCNVSHCPNGKKMT